MGMFIYIASHIKLKASYVNFQTSSQPGHIRTIAGNWRNEKENETFTEKSHIGSRCGNSALPGGQRRDILAQIPHAVK